MLAGCPSVDNQQFDLGRSAQQTNTPTNLFGQRATSGMTCPSQKRDNAMHYLLIYRVTEDYLQRREQFRGDHLALALAAVERGELLLGGALSEPADQALLLFQAESPAPARRFAEADPYVRNGLVQSWEVRPWLTVVGRDAQAPLPPGLGRS